MFLSLMPAGSNSSSWTTRSIEIDGRIVMPCVAVCLSSPLAACCTSTDELAWWGKGSAPFSRSHEEGR